jgi:AraC-like DNA-binding protein
MIAGSDKSSNKLLLPRSVRRAVDAMHANVGRAWTVPELAAVAGVSSRTLQRQFLAFLRKTPGVMLRDISFERARRELLQGSRSAKVMDISLRSGFPHSGRFSVEYRRRYGETPSQTLKRQTVFVASLAAMPSSFVPFRDGPTVAPQPDRGSCGTSPDRGQSCRRPCLGADARRDFRQEAGPIGAISSDRRDPGVREADASDLSIDRQRNRPSALGASLRRHSRRRCGGASRHLSRSGTSAVPAACGDRSCASKTGH